MMEDVILYNESWNIDKLSPYTTFVMEGSIIDGLKRLWQAFLKLLRRIKQRLQYTFNSEARKYRKVVQGLKNPKLVAEWKETRCPKWDYSVIKELVTKGIELCDCILSIKDVFESIEVVDGHATWTPSEISKLANNNNAIIKINGELKSITEKKRQAPVEDGQTVYDLATEWVEIYELVVRYYMRHDEVIKFTKEMDKIVKSLPENQASVTTKLMQNWITGLSYLHNAKTTGPTGVIINAQVDSRDGFVQIKTMLDENSKLLENSLKTVREANAKADESIKDTEKFIRNNKNVLKKYAPWKEYYTKGMSDMKESYEYEYDELDELNAYIEATVNDLHEAMELRNELIQESDDDTVEDFEESDDNFADDYDEASSIKDLPDYHNNEKYNSNPRKDLAHWKSVKNPYEWDGAKARESAERTEKVNDLQMKRIRRRSAPDDLSKMPSRQYIDTKKNRDFWVDQNEKTKNSRPGAGSRNLQAEDTIPRLDKRLQDIKDKHRERMAAKNKSTTEYYSDAIIRNYDDEPYEEETTYRLRSNDMFTESYDDESYGPDRFVHEYMLDTNDDCDTIPDRSENKQKPMNRGKNKGDVIKEYMS